VGGEHGSEVRRYHAENAGVEGLGPAQELVDADLRATGPPHDLRAASRSEEIKNEAQTIGDCGQSIDR
jgi:hypothetical protein